MKTEPRVASGGGRVVRPRAQEGGVGDWLCLAATPAFAALALLPGGEAACGHPGGGMAAMYGLMALFHLPPWLRLLSQS